MSIIKKIGLTKRSLKTKTHQIKIIQETEDTLVAVVESKKFKPLSIEFLNEKLFVNKNEKPLNWMKDFIKIQRLSCKEKIEFIENGKYLDIFIGDKNAALELV